MNRTIAYAYAKINLGLKVLGRRADGYHDILSIFQTIDLHDRLIFEPAARGATEILCDDPGIPAGRENLVFQAVEALREATGTENGIRVVLEKRIPVGAGLGGGSSDAAAVLRVLDGMWALRLSGARLEALAGDLGSDVPFFLRRGTAVVTGRGECLRYIPWQADFHYVLVHPGFQVSSGWAYRNLKIALTEASGYISFLDSIEENGELCADVLFTCLENDFLPLLKTTYPEVDPILSALEASGASACSLSGSGSTLYGVFGEGRQAAEAATGLRVWGYRVSLCRPKV